MSLGAFFYVLLRINLLFINTCFPQAKGVGVLSGAVARKAREGETTSRESGEGGWPGGGGLLVARSAYRMGGGWGLPSVPSAC